MHHFLSVCPSVCQDLTKNQTTVHVTSIEIDRQMTIAATEWAHCQRQVAFFQYSLPTIAYAC